jgi:hypothetical protein
LFFAPQGSPCSLGGSVYRNNDSMAFADLVECSPRVALVELFRYVRQQREALGREGRVAFGYATFLQSRDDCAESVWFVHPLHVRGFLVSGRLRCRAGQPVAREEFYEGILARALYEFYMGSLLASNEPGPHPFAKEYPAW